ncbi:outer membrane protein assembly factor BamD, partial [bacterium]
AKETGHMRQLLAEVTARLVRHELYVARFYLHRDNYDAAVGRILYALRNYTIDPQEAPSANAKAKASRHPDGEADLDESDDALRAQSLEPEALVLLGETYLQMHKWPEAREAFATVLQRYADSSLTTQARKYLAHMRERGV